MFSCDTLDAQELVGLMAGYFHSPETCQLKRWDLGIFSFGISPSSCAADPLG